MGTRGPTPKRSDQRRRRNSPKTTKAKAGRPAGSPAEDLAAAHTREELRAMVTAAGGEWRASWSKSRLIEELGNATATAEADPAWHPAAREWFDSLAKSGQSAFYEPSDWATARLVAESMSRDLKPRVIGITKDGDIVRAEVPLNGASLSAYLKAFNALLVTEADRRRAQLELEKPPAPPEGAQDGADAVTLLSEYRDRSA